MTGHYSQFDLFSAPHPRGMKVLVACEYSGIVRNAFIERGHDAWSCDLLPSEDGSNRHITGDARDHLNDGWDLLMVAHPPCTRLCNSGVRWLSKPPPGKTMDDMQRELRQGAELFSVFWNAPIERICVENPVMHKHAKALIVNYRKFSQSIQPWQFGHGETKRTCFWQIGQSTSGTCRKQETALIHLLIWSHQVKNELKDRLSRYRQIKIRVIGRKSARTSSIPVWFVLKGEKLYLLRVHGSDTQCYWNVL